MLGVQLKEMRVRIAPCGTQQRGALVSERMQHKDREVRP